MALKTKIGKAEFEKLSEDLKKEYIADGDGYKLDADYEDVSGLKAKRDELLAELADIKKKAKAFDGIDPEKAKAALEAAAKAEEEGLAAKGEYETLKAKLEDRHAKELAAANERADSVIGKLRAEKIANLAVSKGVKADRIKAALAEGDLDSIFDLDENDFSVKKKDGIGDAKEIDEIFSGLKTSKPYLFEAGNTEGGGAAGSQTSGGGTPKQLKKSEVDQLDAAAKREFYLNDGEVID